MSAKLCIEDYEIGKSLLDKNKEEEENYRFEKKLKEYHHLL